MDLVLYFKEAERETKNEPARPYRAVTHNSGRYRSKDRYGLLPQVLVEPTFTRIHQYLQEELTQEQDPLQQTPEPKRSEEHTSELQSRGHLVCRLLLEKK